MRVDIAFQGYAEAVDDAVTAVAIGAALRKVSTAFGYEFVLIAELAKQTSVHPALVYASEPREARERFGPAARFRWEPILQAVRRAPAPLSFSAIRAKLRLDAAAWNGLIPAWLWDCEGLALCLTSGEGHVWYFEFAGRNPTDGLARSVLHVAADLASHRLEGLVRGEPRHPTLSPRESEALGLIATGKSDAQAAEAMRVTPRTIRFHVDNAKKKLGVATRAQAIVQALRGRGAQRRARAAGQCPSEDGS